MHFLCKNYLNGEKYLQKNSLTFPSFSIYNYSFRHSADAIRPNLGQDFYCSIDLCFIEFC